MVETTRAPSIMRIDPSKQLHGESNYKEWCAFYLISFGLTLDPLIAEGGGIKPTDATKAAEWAVMQQWGASQIMAGVDIKEGNRTPVPSTARTAYEVWQALKTAFDPKSASTLLVESLKVLNFTLPSSPSVEAYDEAVANYRSDIQRAKDKGLDTETILSVIFISSLPPSLETTLKIATSNRSSIPDLNTLISTMRGQVVIDNASTSTRESALFGNASSSRANNNSKFASRKKQQQSQLPGPCPHCGKGKHWLSDCTAPGAAEAIEARDERKWGGRRKQEKGQLAEEEYSFVASKQIDPLTAHRRLCHRSSATVSKLASLGRDVIAIKSSSTSREEVKNCAPCRLAKAKQASFPANNSRAARPLDLIHSDLLEWNVKSWGNKKWICTFLDDHTRVLYIALLGKKSDALEAFKTWLAKVERQSGLKVKAFKSDNGGEYISRDFTDFLASQGIEQQFTSPHSAPENARAEAVNETITRGINSIMTDSGLPERWWGEAAQTVVYTYNRTPHSALGGRIPIVEWSGKPVDLSNLRAFGCECYVYIPKATRRKNQPTSYRGVFLGYDLTTKHFRVMNPSLPPNRAVKFARSVTFNEKVFPYRKQDDISGSFKATPALPPSVRLNTTSSDSSSSQTLLTRSNDEPTDDRVTEDEAEILPPLPSPTPNQHWPPPPPRDLPEQQQSPKPSTSSAESSPSIDSPLAGRETSARAEPSSPSPSSPHQINSPEQQVQDPSPPSPAPSSPDPLDLLGGLAEEENPFDAWVRGGAQGGDDGRFEALLASAGAEGTSSEIFTLPTDDPRNIREALGSEESSHWKDAILDEVKSLVREEDQGGYGVLEVLDRSDIPRGKTILPSKIVFARKRDHTGRVVDYRARLVAMGSQQIPGKDFHETYSPTLKAPSLRIMFALAAQEGYIIEQTDISKAYLHGEIDTQDLYMILPAAVAQFDPSLVGKAVRLKKALYGLKQAGVAWNDKLVGRLKSIGYTPTKSDRCLLVHRRPTPTGIEYDYMTVYVDDQLHLSKIQEEIDRQKAELKAAFRKIKEVGRPSKILGVEVTKTDKGWHLSLPTYCRSLVGKFLEPKWRRVHIPMEPKVPSSMPPVDENASPDIIRLYASIIGCLTYACHSVRLDISFAVGVLCRYARGPTQEHVDLALRVVRYLATYPTLGIHYTSGGDGIRGFADASLADAEKVRSTMGYVWLMGNGPVIWRSGSQDRAACSTGEAEFLSLSEAAKDAVWLKSLHQEIGLPLQHPLPLASDSTAALSYTNDSSHHRRFRQVRIEEQVAKDCVEDGTIKTLKVDTRDQLADSLTKALPRETLERHRLALNLVEPPQSGSRGGVEERRS